MTPLVDLRHMPREVQEIAFGTGMIPYVPADGSKVKLLLKTR